MKTNVLTIFVILLLGSIVGTSGIIVGDFETNMERTSAQIFPQIVSTDPYDNERKVDLYREVMVNFSEPMNTLTVTYSCNPTIIGGFTPSWSPDNKNVTFSHVADFEKTTTYKFEITGGNDIDSNPLVQGSIPNPWNFNTVADNPTVIKTTPMHDDTGVGLYVDIIVEFSQPMDKTTVTYSCSPTIVGGFTAQWNVNNDTVTYSHTTDFETETIYKFEITGGNDIDDNPLVQDSIPNPWSFTTRPDNPTIEDTSPADYEANVPLGADIVVTFSDPMDTGTVALQCTPDPGDWSTPIWDPLNMVVTYSHSTAFAKNTEYTCQITAGKGENGLDLNLSVNNPWSFTTADDNPTITLTSPEDGETNVLLNAEISVAFSEAMNTTTVQYKCTPSVTGGFSADWNLDNTEVSYQHTADFAKNTLYTFRITAGKDQVGYDLVAGSIPNPFVFTTVGDNPVIIGTTPADGSTGVALDADIIVVFSKQMNTHSVTYESSPSPATGYSSSWNAGGDTLTFSHTASFIKDQAYSFKITGGMDTSGLDLVAGTIPNPWTFRTKGDEPVIFSTNPAEGETSVKPSQEIVIEFSEAMSIATVTYTISSAAGDPGGWSASWSNGDKTLTLDHNKFVPDTKYKFEITVGQDLSGSALIAGPVPNPFEFTTPNGPYRLFTTSLTPADDVNVTSLKPMLTWNATSNSVEYYVFLGRDKAQVNNLDYSVMSMVTDTSYTPAYNLEPGTTYYWTVIPSDGTIEGTSESGVWSFNTPTITPAPKEKDQEELEWGLWFAISIAVIVTVILVILIIIVYLMPKRLGKRPPPEESRMPWYYDRFR